MSKLLGCFFIATGVALGGVATTLMGDRSEAAVDAANGAETLAVSKPAREAAVPAPDAAPRKPIAPFETVTIPDDPVSLARALQAELRRVGCYDGDINGVWSTASKRATKAFIDRVNATLPTDKPDYVLLALAQGQRGPVCGASCPAGQVLSERGVCSPSAIVAQAQRRQQAGHRVAAVVPSASPPAPTTALKPATPPEKAGAWSVKVDPAPPAAEKRPAIPFDAPRMALAGPPPAETAVTPPPAPTAAEIEKADAERHRARARPARHDRERRRSVYAEVPRRSNFWVNDFFRKIDRDSF